MRRLKTLLIGILLATAGFSAQARTAPPPAKQGANRDEGREAIRQEVGRQRAEAGGRTGG